MSITINYKDDLFEKNYHLSKQIETSDTVIAIGCLTASGQYVQRIKLLSFSEYYNYLWKKISQFFLNKGAKLKRLLTVYATHPNAERPLELKAFLRVLA